MHTKREKSINKIKIMTCGSEKYERTGKKKNRNKKQNEKKGECSWFCPIRHTHECRLKTRFVWMALAPFLKTWGSECLKNVRVLWTCTQQPPQPRPPQQTPTDTSGESTTPSTAKSNHNFNHLMPPRTPT